MDKPIWVVVANGSMARLLERDPAKPQAWVEKECLTHPQSRLQGAEAGQEPAGHSIAGRSGLAPRSEPHAHERRKFAQQVAHAVKGAMGDGQGAARWWCLHPTRSWGNCWTIWMTRPASGYRPAIRWI